MSNEALNDIQKALNVIRNATDNEQYTTKVKALELITQSLLSHIQELGLVPRGRNLSKKRLAVICLSLCLYLNRLMLQKHLNQITILMRLCPLLKADRLILPALK